MSSDWGNFSELSTEFPYALARKGKAGNLMTYCIGKLHTVISTKGF